MNMVKSRKCFDVIPVPQANSIALDKTQSRGLFLVEHILSIKPLAC